MARAMGGDVQAGNSYLVGERGPEIITMGGNGHVTPNHKLGGDTKVTIVNQTTGKIDKVEERRMPDGELILTVIEAVAAQTLDPNSKISRNQELLRIQYAKIDALKAEEEAKTQQKEVDSFMAQQAQELDALRQSFATKNEIA